jgi:hypothetical protein
MKYRVILRSLKNPDEMITLNSDATSLDFAQQQRKMWRKALGDKKWTQDRRPGLDTLDHLTLSIEKANEEGN